MGACHCYDSARYRDEPYRVGQRGPQSCDLQAEGQSAENGDMLPFRLGGAVISQLFTKVSSVHSVSAGKIPTRFTEFSRSHLKGHRTICFLGLSLDSTLHTVLRVGDHIYIVLSCYSFPHHVKPMLAAQ